MSIRSAAVGAALILLTLPACARQRISELEEGVSAETDVRKRFGTPENAWEGPGGERIFEYNRQPALDWRYLQPPNTSMVFTAWFSPDERVLRAGSSPDPEATANGIRIRLSMKPAVAIASRTLLINVADRCDTRARRRVEWTEE